MSQLRKAGAIILGKTNLSEWANFRGKRSISGWSSRGGLTRNPYALDRTACGSSSGSGAAVAANLCAAAIGTETDGSIICPSNSNGLVGIKPTLGLLSRSGIIPIAYSQDTPGPMARTVTDAAILLGALTGLDERDSATRASRKHALQGYTAFLNKDGLKGARIGVARKLAGDNARILGLFEICLDVLKQLGAIIVDPADVPNHDKFGKTELDVLNFEFKADLNKYLATLGSDAPVHSMQEVIEFNEQNKARVMPYFGQEHLIEAQAKGPLSNKTYRAALAKNHRLTRQEGIDAVMRKHRLDALVVPSGGPAWLIDLVNGDSENAGVDSTSVAAVSGYPHITVPAAIFWSACGIFVFWQGVARSQTDSICVRVRAGDAGTETAAVFGDGECKLMTVSQVPDASSKAALRQLIDGYRVSQLLYVVAELGIADLLNNGPKPYRELAQATDTHPQSLFRALRGLASIGVFTQVDEERFALNEMSAPLVRDAPYSLHPAARMVGNQFYPAWSNVMHTVRTGETAFDALFGKTVWEYREQNPEAGQLFNALMSTSGAVRMEIVAASLDWARFATIVDVGGGRGHCSQRFCKPIPMCAGLCMTSADRHVRQGCVWQNWVCMTAARWSRAVLWTACLRAATLMCLRGFCTTGRMRMRCKFCITAAPRCRSIPRWCWWNGCWMKWHPRPSIRLAI